MSGTDERGSLVFGAAPPLRRPSCASQRASLDLGALQPDLRRATRGQWGSRMDYLMVLLGYAIGIGNLWRFPYLVGKYGGGSFVVAYLVCLCLVSAPLFFLELVWGQSSRKNTIDCFRSINTRWVGVAYSSCSLVFTVSTYYNILLAYCLVYLGNSFQHPLPWTEEALGGDRPPLGRTAAEHYWHHNVLNSVEVDRIDSEGIGAPHWPLVVALAATYLMITAALYKGHESLAWAAYPLVILPVLIIIVIFGRAVSLEGAEKGVEFYLGKFDTDKLVDGEMWAAACGQIIFSLSPAMGTAVTMSSYTDPKENVERVALIVACCNSIFSIFGGFGTFSILGYMSHRSCTNPDAGPCRSVADLASQGGTGLAFISLAEGIGTFGKGWSQVFSVLLFVTLFVLGLDSTFAWVETINTYVNDALLARGKTVPRWITASMSSLVLFAIGVLYCTRAGNYLLDIVDHFVGSHTLLAVAAFELLMYRMDYGADRAIEAVRSACGRTLCGFWQFAWNWSSPVLICFLFCWIFITDAITPYEGYPAGLLAVGWTGFALIVSVSLVGVVFDVVRKRRRGYEEVGDVAGEPCELPAATISVHA
eukprot:TRINITY_DN36228_c0_g1_i1.p1 TRINITY_DN36228_c0_g1~~TRINITY_DN36228_c0_g1_i1.p1  ORF type:complete len:591 (+),score=132.20 TRINITY_DN36228_c0_g1_i1:43-1815(+)